jgi:hypothetical protein
LHLENSATPNLRRNSKRDTGGHSGTALNSLLEALRSHCPDRGSKLIEVSDWRIPVRFTRCEKGYPVPRNSTRTRLSLSNAKGCYPARARNSPKAL